MVIPSIESMVDNANVPADFKYLSIYNKFGQKVFETNNYEDAWDGIFMGKKQDPGVYVWICSYRFSNKNSKKNKGYLVLVR